MGPVRPHTSFCAGLVLVQDSVDILKIYRQMVRIYKRGANGGNGGDPEGSDPGRVLRTQPLTNDTN